MLSNNPLFASGEANACEVDHLVSGRAEEHPLYVPQVNFSIPDIAWGHGPRCGRIQPESPAQPTY